MKKKITTIRLISLFSGIYFWLFTGITAYANPQGPQVVHGQAGFSNPNQNTLHVTNSPNAIINWKGFSIQQHEVTRFIQQSGNSAVLNRVTGGNPSNLLGQLLSNGKVFLINPNGMVFGPNCVIDTAGFVASTLNITDQDFLEGNLKFEGGSDPGSIINQGFITTGKNGDIYLIAPDIENSGIIHTVGGKLILAAGEKVTITSLDLKDVHFEIQAPDNEVLNLGKVLADGGAVGIFAGTLKHNGEIQANTVEVDEQGIIVLKALDDIHISDDSTVTANGVNGQDAGQIRIIAEGGISPENNATIFQQGDIHADGRKGGSIEIRADAMLATGAISADGIDKGGDVDIQLNGRFLATSSSSVSADGGYGGEISIKAMESLYTSGTYTATGITGGTVHLLGNEVKLASALVDVSGTHGGGDILAGGGFRGKEFDILNAQTTLVNAGTTLKAYASQTGDGGTVVVWSDNETRFSGKITATGGEESGDGGIAEVSGKEALSYNGLVDLSAPAGETGTLLLDPKNIIIQGSTGPIIIELIDPNPQAGDLFGGDREELLSNGYIAVHEPEDDFAGMDAGAFYIFDPANGNLVSSLTGTQAGDLIGNAYLYGMGSDYYILRSYDWDADRGALTLFHADTGVSGPISDMNSLVGAIPGDLVGNSNFTNLSNNKYTIRNSNWGNGAGSVTWFDVTAGLNGVVDPTNSLVGSTADDNVGYRLENLGNDKWGVFSPYWDNGPAVDAGAVTIFDRDTGVPVGVVSSANSLVGTHSYDYAGTYPYYGSHYADRPSLTGSFLFIRSREWNSDAGAVTWYDTTSAPITGEISAANSLVGSTPGDEIGLQYKNLNTDNKFAMISPYWDNGLAIDAGAITIFDVTAGISGEVSNVNSLVGTQDNDMVGSDGIAYLGYSGASYKWLILSPDWNSGAGAVTWYDPTSPPITEDLSGTNSLIGSTAGDGLGGQYESVNYGGSYNRYALMTPAWDNGSAVDAGAVTLFDSGTGEFVSAPGVPMVGTIDNTNSLVGTQTGDQVGSDGLEYVGYTYSGGYHYKYIAKSSNWNSGAGAVTWFDTDSGIAGEVDSLNSLVGSTPSDGVGSQITGIGSNVYAIISPDWDNGPTNDAGAVTFFDGPLGEFKSGGLLTGTIDNMNSLVGVSPGSRVGSGGIESLSGSNKMLRSPEWNDGSGTDMGALTWFNASTGLTGNVGPANSFVGTHSDDDIGNSSLLSIGNSQYLIASPDWDDGIAFDAGAVTSFDYTMGITGSHNSGISLVGTQTGDRVGSGGLYNLNYSNYFLYSPEWDGNSGALTWFNSSSSPLPTGSLDSSNSFVGAGPGDQIGSDITNLGYHGSSYKYLIQSPDFNGGAGAVTWIDSTSGISGEVDPTNSLIGSTPGDAVDSWVTKPYYNADTWALFAPNWDNGSTVDAGSVTFFDPETGNFLSSGTPMVGTVHSTNSLVGTHDNDNVGIDGYTGLDGSGILINSYGWNAGAGAVTWVDTYAGIQGEVSASNSLVGSTSGDMAGQYHKSLSGGMYALVFSEWNNAAGSITIFDTATGITGVISGGNSLIGDQPGDRIGTYDPDYYWSDRSARFNSLGGDRYLIFSPDWHSGAGAVTWVDLTAPPVGVINSANSLVGSSPGDRVGISNTYYGYIYLNSVDTDKYGLLNPYWNSNAGAITWIDASTGISGVVGASNSLIGSTAGDDIGNRNNWDNLPNGKYYVRSQNWDNGPATDAGAITFFDSMNLPTGFITSANSLVGTHANDRVGNNYDYTIGDYALFRHTNWNNSAGAVTWYDTTTPPLTGEVSSSNSLVGSTAGDNVGNYGINNLGNNKYMFRSPYWDNGAIADAGAITIFDAATSIQGPVSSANSLVGTHTDDRIGYDYYSLGSGKYLFNSYLWNQQAGAVTWYDSANAPISGEIDSDNSLLGSAANDRLGYDITNLGGGKALLTAPSADTIAGGVDAGRIYHFSFPTAAPSGDLLFSDSPFADFILGIDSILATLEAGTNLLLQANNDISVMDAINVDNTSGDGGNFTLQAGRSILINGDILTDNGNFTAIANSTVADGVVDAYRDMGPAHITMADGTTVDAGTGNIELELRTGAGLTYSTSGHITIENLIGQHISVTMNGTTDGSSILRSSNDSLITASSLFIDHYPDEGGPLGLNGSVGTQAEPLRVHVDNLAAGTHHASPGLFFDLQNSATTTIGGTFFGGGMPIQGLETLGGGNIGVTSVGAIDSTAVIRADVLEVSANGAVTLSNAGNAVSSLNVISYTDDVMFVNSLPLELDLLNVTGTAHVKVSSGSITDNNGPGLNVIGTAGVILEAPVNIGTLADPLEIQTPSLTVQGTHTGEVAVANTGNLVFGGGVGMSDLLLTTTGTLSLTGPIGSGTENLDVRGNGFDLSGFPVNGADVMLSGGSGTLDINSTGVQGSYVDLAGSQIRIRQGFAPPAQVTSTGEMYIHGGGLIVDSADVQSNAHMNLQTSSVTLRAEGMSNTLVKAGGDMTVTTGSLKVFGSTTSASLSSKLEAGGNMDISADSVTVQGGSLPGTYASIDPSNLVMKVSNDVNVLGGAGDGSFSEISGGIVEITAGPTLDAGNINITGGTGNNAGAWIKSTGGDVTLIAGDILFPADINLIGGAGINSDSLIEAGGGAFDVYLTFHNGVGFTLLPGLTPATDVGILAMNLFLNSYDPFYQPPIDPMSDILSSQDQLDELMDDIMEAPGNLTTEDGAGDEEEEEECGRLICREN